MASTPTSKNNETIPAPARPLVPPLAKPPRFFRYGDQFLNLDLITTIDISPGLAPASNYLYVTLASNQHVQIRASDPAYQTLLELLNLSL